MLLCCVSFWFWWEKGFDLHTHVLLRVQYSCGGVLVIWFWREKGVDVHMHVLLRVQYSCGGVLVVCFWWEIVFGVTQIISVQYSCAVVSIFWL